MDLQSVSYLARCEPDIFSENAVVVPELALCIVFNRGWLSHFSYGFDLHTIQGLFLSALSATLHRRLRVDLVNGNSIDGGGIFCEWLHLVCDQLFLEPNGCLNSPVQPLIKNLVIDASFYWKWIGKAILECSLLNVRLSNPLLKHFLGLPLKISDCIYSLKR
ncbi:hypothetical protein PsorP6_015882 [Peronosclerospora sorghi]|uniref:Uncharacterized protein n=1 Tax=Peronosclerospora sorghi TaxID=230839 RepID=A0ACC0WPS4_9STRA|nr:hypothetical protein PsorP6_015882 [Peronosclerospora sorghi]